MEIGIDLVLQKQEMLAFILFPVEVIANHKVDASLLLVVNIRSILSASSIDITAPLAADVFGFPLAQCWNLLRNGVYLCPAQLRPVGALWLSFGFAVVSLVAMILLARRSRVVR